MKATEDVLRFTADLIRKTAVVNEIHIECRKAGEELNRLQGALRDACKEKEIAKAALGRAIEEAAKEED